ncbi:MAG: hypothetical protein ABMA64_40335 [Myxococcota bacterium]
MTPWIVSLACQPDGSGDKPAEQTASPPITTVPVTEPETDTTTDDGCERQPIGPGGGVVSLSEFTVTLPEGALAGQVVVELCPADPPLGVTPLSAVVALGPAELALARPAQVSALHSGQDTPIGLFVTGADGAPWLQWAAESTVTDVRGAVYHPGPMWVAADTHLVEQYLDGGGGDLLMVVDNSCSMADEQALLGQNMRGVLQLMLDSGIDFHLGVVSTDMDAPTHSGILRESAGVSWVEPTTPYLEDVFAEMVNMGTTGSGSERGTEAAYTAIEVLGDTENAGFLRDGLPFGVLVVSDEPDFTNPNVLTPQEYVGWLDGLEADHGETWSHSIVTTSGYGTGDTYLYASGQTGGLVLDITTADWTPFLEQVMVEFGQPGTGRELDQIPLDGEVAAWAAPDDGSEPYLLDPATVSWDEGENRVIVDPVPEGAVVWLVYLPA